MVSLLSGHGHGGWEGTYTERFLSSLMALISIFLRPMMYSRVQERFFGIAITSPRGVGCGGGETRRKSQRQ